MRLTDEQLDELLGSPRVTDRDVATATNLVRETALYTCGCHVVRMPTPGGDQRRDIMPCRQHARTIYPEWFKSSASTDEAGAP